MRALLERLKMNISNNLLAVLVIVAIAMSIVGTTSMISLMVPPEPAEPIPTGMASSLVATGTALANLAAEAAISLVDDHQTVDFGSMTLGESKNTTDGDPYSFVIENNGSIEVNISMGISGDSLWASSYNDGNFTFNASKNYTVMTEQVDYLWLLTDPTTAVSNQTATTCPPDCDAKDFVYNLTSNDGRDRLDVHLYVTVPPGEPSGAKTTLARFNASVG